MDVNKWFLSLPPERQAVLRDDKWMLASAVSQAATELARESCAQMCDERVRVEQAKAEQALASGDQPRWAMYYGNAGQNKLMAQEIRAGAYSKDDGAPVVAAA